MTWRRKKQIGKELAAIASLRDSDIDTSDIPEITDWSQAVVGRFHPFAEISISRPASSDAAFTPRPLPIPIPGPQQSAGIALAEMANRQLILECVQGETVAWEEFVRRWHKLIVSAVLRTARHWGKTSLEVVEDLVQETYLKLAANDFELLKKFYWRHENAIVGFIKVVANNVANDYLRSAYAAKHAEGSTSEELESELVTLESSSVVTKMENAVFMEEIDRALKAIASERDRAIFWLHYRHGLSAEAIASIPAFGLTIKGTESAIFRITKALRHDLVQALPTYQSQTGTLAQPLVDQILRRARSPKKKD